MAEAHSTTEYREIPGFPGYRAGSDGTIWSCWWPAGKSGARMMAHWRLRKAEVHKYRGPGRTYLSIDLTRDGVRHSFLVHRLILEAFVGPRPEGMECRHLDGNPRNNAISNLCWGTPEENKKDTRRLDRFAVKLTEQQVREIRARYAAGGVLQRELATEYNTTRMNISSIITRASWKHLD